MSRQHLFRTALALFLVVLGTSCAELEKAKEAATDAARTAAAALQPRPEYWNDEGVSGSPKIVVSLSDQRA